MSLRVPVVVTALVRLFPTDFGSAPAFEHQRLSSAEMIRSGLSSPRLGLLRAITDIGGALDPYVVAAHDSPSPWSMSRPVWYPRQKGNPS